MRYVFVSDIHGRFDKLQTALQSVGFDPNNDTLVSLGDPFDRGEQNLEVLYFLVNLPHKILVWGNHDLRLQELYLGKDSVDGCDYSNGMLQTIRDFTGFQSTSNIADGLWMIREFSQCEEVKRLLEKYFRLCVYAVEWSDLVAVHGWIPVLVDDKKTTFDKWGWPMTTTYYKYWYDWRTANPKEWYEATWEHTQKMVGQELFIPDKTIIVGHWHAWRLRKFVELKEVTWQPDEIINHSTFSIPGKLIAIDGCSNAEGGVVNAFAYVTDEVPTLIKGE